MSVDTLLTDDGREVRSRTVYANGHRVHLLECGTGPMVFFIHGFPELSHSWLNQMSAVSAAGYKAVAIDQLGYGRSSKPLATEAYRITELVQTAVETVQALGYETATVVGHDWGAPVAWSCVWMRPDVFTSVVALSVPFGGRGQMAFPGSLLGERRPREIERLIAGPDLLFYQEYYYPPGVPEADMEKDIRKYLLSAYYSFSGDPELPADALVTRPDGVDLEASASNPVPSSRTAGCCPRNCPSGCRRTTSNEPSPTSNEPDSPARSTTTTGLWTSTGRSSPPMSIARWRFRLSS
jgi:pimeloyl-ACP methyl ester carboxylesterase